MLLAQAEACPAGQVRVLTPSGLGRGDGKRRALRFPIRSPMAEHTVDLRGLWADWGDQNSDAGTPGDEALGTATRRVTRVAD